MAAKRKRRSPPQNKSLAQREATKRDFTAWGWVGSDVSDPSHIARENLLATCGFSSRNGHPICANSYRLIPTNLVTQENETATALDTETGSDVIIISDDEPPACSKKICRKNPNCLNYLGQEVWENEDDAKELFLRASKLGPNPILDSRDPNLPVGLKNLGATCYANAFIQVWFRDLAFRKGVYQCQPSQGQDEIFEKSPIFQLQATFAALQESIQSVFNPSKLVESLQLRTTEQQDAQEFSKLFMSHLDTEFQKQSDPLLKSFITDKFQGQQVYGTICENPSCTYRSEHNNDFLEIEISLDSNSSLEDRISALLQPEKLSGDNQYNCPRCESLQDATRYTEFRRLPSVLHFSLLRFIYDFSSMERKKSKHVISFPTSLDMSHFLCSDHRDASVEGNAENHLFELRGVLLHKGASAYHGHYEAQVFDTANNSWFQFNDESVTEIKTLTEKKGDSAIDIIGDGCPGKSDAHSHRRRTPARKKRRIDDSDDELINATSPENGSPARLGSCSTPGRVASKDAYMLIYSRRIRSPPTETLQIPMPPARALDVVNQLNAAHDEACERYQEREKAVQRMFEEIRPNVMEIYQSWDISSANEVSAVVSREALERWLSVETIVSALQGNESGDLCTMCHADAGTDGALLSHSGTEQIEQKNCNHHQQSIEMKAILCPHGKLDPQEASEMKRISQAACEMISAKTNCAFNPHLTTEDICIDCVKLIFAERLYAIEHPLLVNQFDQLCENDQDETSPGFWISKKWIKDWRLVRPKMHSIAKTDPSPDEAEYLLDVYCEHGELSLNNTNRRRIPAKACEVIMGLYPTWNPMTTNAESCAICETLTHVSKEDKREIRKMAEEEKARLKNMNETALNASFVLENVPCAIMPTHFIRTWRRWLLRPTENARPEVIDNGHFICEHDRLNFDPNNPSDLDSSISIIKRSEWDYLESLYSGGPLITLEKCVNENDVFGAFVHDIPVCVDCRLKRKSDWDVTDITVRILGPNDPLAVPDGPCNTSSMNGTQIPTLIQEPGKSVRLRQSKRLRQIKQGRGERQKLTVWKQTTLKDIKVHIHEMLGIPTICQRMFFRGQELDDNAVTMASLGVLLNDVIDLREDTEEEALMISDDEVIPDKKKRREEERGFGGTLLGSQLPYSSSPISSPPVSSDDKSCIACTFHNPADAESCYMCLTPLL